MKKEIVFFGDNWQDNDYNKLLQLKEQYENADLVSVGDFVDGYTLLADEPLEQDENKWRELIKEWAALFIKVFGR